MRGRNLIIVGAAGLVLAACSSKSSSSPTTAAAAGGSTATTAAPATAPPTTAAPATTKPSPTTTTTKPAPVPTTVWTQSGSGQSSGAKFTIPAGTKEWDEVWSYDCSAFGGSGNFITSVNGFDSASGTTDAGVNQLGANGSGTEHYYDTGTFSIDVNSECAWTDKAVTVPG